MSGDFSGFTAIQKEDESLVSDTPGYYRLENLVSCIERDTQRSVPVFLKPLESGAAEKAGTMGFLAPVSVHEVLALFVAPSPPGPEALDDIIAHAKSAGALYAVIFPPDKDIWIRCGPEEDGGYLSELYRVQKGTLPDLPGLQALASNPSEKLSLYLAEIRRSLNGWFYRKEGEGSESVRDLTVQALMHQVILHRISNAHGTGQDSGTCVTLRDALFSFASRVPDPDQQYHGTVQSNTEDCREIVARLVSEPATGLSTVRLSWIEPETWALISARHLQALEKRERRKRSDQNRSHVRQPEPLTGTVLGKAVTGALHAGIRRFFPGKIYDPSAGSGQMIAIILTIIRIRSVLTRETDTIKSRLITAGETIFATEPSAIHTLVIRLVLVIWIIGGQLRERVLAEEPLWYPLMNLTAQIRTGNPVFGEEFSREFISFQNGYPVIRQIHPINPASLMNHPGNFSLIITVPDKIIPEHIPEVAAYLTRNYQSYQKGVSSACLYAERISGLIAPGSAGLIYMPDGWTRESSYRGFRRWLRQRLPVTVIRVDDPSLKTDQEFSAIILRTGEERDLRVIRISKDSAKDKPIMRDYDIPCESLSEDDGWRLDDPWEEYLLHRISTGTMTLTGYLFEEIYPNTHEDPGFCPLDGWTSLIIEGRRILVEQGDIPDLRASAIIPGKDRFLTGLLHSTLVAWYIQVMAGRTDPDQGVILNMIKSLPIAPVDHYDVEERRIHARIERITLRMQFLTRQKSIVHSWHDQARLDRQMSAVQEELDNLVFSLYRLSGEEEDEVRRRVHNPYLSENPTTCIDIF